MANKKATKRKASKKTSASTRTRSKKRPAKKASSRASKKKATKKRVSKKAPKKRSAKKTTKKRASKKSAKKKVAKKTTKARVAKKTTKKRTAKKVARKGRKPRSPTRAKAAGRGRKTKAGTKSLVSKRRTGFRSPEVEKLYDHFTKKTVREEALRCQDVKHCVSYIDELFDALDNVFAAWFSVRDQAEVYAGEISDLVEAVDSTEAELKGHRKQLAAAKKRDAIGAADLKTLKSMLEGQSKLLRQIVADVRGVAKAKRIPVARKKAKTATKQMPLRGLFSPSGPGSGAGCSLAASRWGYSGSQDCAPYGYRAGEAGRRLANLRHHGVAFNPSEYFEMGREFERSKKPKPKPVKRRAPKRNPSPQPTTKAAPAKDERRSRASLFRRLGI